MSLDTHTNYNPTAPWNQKESKPLTELEQLQEDYSDLRSKMQKAKKQLQYCINLVPGHQTLLKNNLLKIKL